MPALINFPELKPPDFPLTETPEEAVLRSSAEDGSVQTRPKFTRIRFTFEVTWNHMPEEMKQILEDFYRNTTKNGALSFNWTHPTSNKSYIVRFTKPPTFRAILLHYWTISISLQEV